VKSHGVLSVPTNQPANDFPSLIGSLGLVAGLPYAIFSILSLSPLLYLNITVLNSPIIIFMFVEESSTID